MKDVVDYLNHLIKERSLNTGKLEDYDVEIKGVLCPKKGHKDQVFITIKKEGDRVKDMKFICMYCDPYMYVAAHVATDLFKGKNEKEIEGIDERRIVEITGVDDEKLIEHFMRVKYLILSKL